MAKILILANNDVGLYKFRKELIERLLEVNEVHLALPYGDYVPNLIDMGCHFIDSPVNRRGTNPFSDFKLLLKYRRVINNIKPDIVLTYTIKPNIYGGLACRISAIPYIVNITGLGTAVEKNGPIQKLLIFLYKISLKKSKFVFFQNKSNEKFFLENNILNKNYKTIPGSGVNLSEYSLREYPTDEVINFLFVARIMKEKGIEEYLEAAQFIRNKYTNTRFHILGFCEDNYEHRLSELHDSGVIIYHGMQKNVRDYYEIAHCTVHPTFYPEGMSNVLLESAAMGRPIITTDRSGCREIVDDTVNGFIVKQQDGKDLIDKIEMFLELDHITKKRMGIMGREKVEKEFDRRYVVESYLTEIDNVLGSREWIGKK